MVSRFSYLMSAAVEGRSQIGEVSAWLRGFCIERQKQKVACSVEKLAHCFEVFTLNGSSN
jgi:hypothetical protein